jgi:PleD family two-component response regulator
LRLYIERENDKSAACLLALGAVGKEDSSKFERTASNRTRPLRVLLVDDNSTSQQSIRRMIINAPGVLCDVAGNGKEAMY